MRRPAKRTGTEYKENLLSLDSARSACSCACKDVSVGEVITQLDHRPDWSTWRITSAGSMHSAPLGSL
jgi:hypothetical protein